VNIPLFISHLIDAISAFAAPVSAVTLTEMTQQRHTAA
jgi:hypothetical protein